jgi:hypothetical protein
MGDLSVRDLLFNVDLLPEIPQAAAQHDPHPQCRGMDPANEGHRFAYFVQYGHVHKVEPQR